MSHWFVYIIRADDDSLYTGITTNPVRRWREHSNGKAGAKFFRGRAPKQFALLELAENRSLASQREAALKKLSRTNKLALIASQNQASQKLLAQQAESQQIPFFNVSLGETP